MRIGVLSDTHIPGKRKVLPEKLTEGFKGVDLILHAGDINEDYVLYELEELAPVEAVAGNTDDEYMRGVLGKRKVITIGKIKIGMVHGDGTKGTTLERVKKEFEHEDVSCIVFGHSHIPFHEVLEGILYFNPGSPTDKRRQEYFSYGILHVDGDKVNGEMVYFD